MFWVEIVGLFGLQSIEFLLKLQVDYQSSFSMSDSQLGWGSKSHR